MFEFRLPDLGEGIHEGEILKWHVAAGETVAEDAPLVDLETDKAAVTIPSPRGGRVVSVAGKPGDVLRVGDVLAVIDDGSGGEASAEGGRRASEAAGTSDGGPVPAAPATRKLARELGVAIDSVPGTGPGGRVTPEDVRRAAAKADAGTPAPEGPRLATLDSRLAAPGSSPIPFLDLEPLPDFEAQGPVERLPLRSIRRKTARAMVTSMILIPHVAHLDEADVTELDDLRRRRKAARGGALTLLPFVVKAVAATLRGHPAFNASLDPFREELVCKRFYNVGFATDTPRGLIVPVLRDADRTSVADLNDAIRALAERARDGTIEAGDLRDGTFTITNVGGLGGTGLIPAIFYPQSAILGMGRAGERPVVRDGQVVVRTILPLTLSFDHRIADGADAARFMGDLVRRLSDPETLLMET